MANCGSGWPENGRFREKCRAQRREFRSSAASSKPARSGWAMLLILILFLLMLMILLLIFLPSGTKGLGS